MSQIIKKFIGNNQVDDTKIRLLNDGSLKARNQADSADVEIVKVNASDEVDFNGNPLTNLADPTNAQDAATKNYVDSALNVVPGDIQLTSFTAQDDQGTPDDVTGLSFSNAVTKAADVLLSIDRGPTSATYTLNLIQKTSSWEMSQSYVGDDTGLVFSVTNAGQVQYTSTSTGDSALVKFRAYTTTV